MSERIPSTMDEQSRERLQALRGLKVELDKEYYRLREIGSHQSFAESHKFERWSKVLKNFLEVPRCPDCTTDRPPIAHVEKGGYICLTCEVCHRCSLYRDTKQEAEVRFYTKGPTNDD